MKHLLNYLFGVKKRGPKTRVRRVHLGVEGLEERLVPATYTDMTQVAQLVPAAHVGATNVYLNFDGGNNGTVTAFDQGKSAAPL